VRIAFFTAGTLGAGHRARGIAIGRALDRAGFSGEYRMFGPAPGAAADAFPAVPMRGWEDIEISAAQLTVPGTARVTDLATRLAAFSPDVLVVDMFWAPLRHILPLPGCEAWLLLRSMPATWLAGPPGVEFDPMHYARIFSIEPIGSGAVTHPIDPVVMVNHDECRPRGALRARLGMSPEQRLVAVMHAGLPGEHRGLVPASKPGDLVATFDLHEANALFPIASFLGDADELHCVAGYNAYWEARWLGYAPRTTFSAIARRNDDPAWRIAKCGRYVMRANGADTLASWLIRGS
jgi:hypothetical protein